MTRIEHQLERLGLDAKEAVAYVALLELGQGTLAELARKAKIKRTTLYDIVNTLKVKGLASTIRSGGRLLYSAEDPRTLQTRLEEQNTTLSRVLPELLSIANALPLKPKVRYYEGIEGIKEVYRDCLRYPQQKMHAWVSDSMIESFDSAFISEYYIPKRLEQKIWAEVIVADTPTGRKFQQKDQEALRTTKLLNAEATPISVEINLYGPDRVGFMSINDQMGLIIESKPIAETLKSIFTQQWANLPS